MLAIAYVQHEDAERAHEDAQQAREDARLAREDAQRAREDAKQAHAERPARKTSTLSDEDVKTIAEQVETAIRAAQR